MCTNDRLKLALSKAQLFSGNVSSQTGKQHKDNHVAWSQTEPPSTSPQSKSSCRDTHPVVRDLPFVVLAVKPRTGPRVSSVFLFLSLSPPGMLCLQENGRAHAQSARG